MVVNVEIREEVVEKPRCFGAAVAADSEGYAANMGDRFVLVGGGSTTMHSN